MQSHKMKIISLSSSFFLLFIISVFFSLYPIPTSADTYERHVSYLNSYLSQIRSKESHIKELVKRKNHTSNPKEVEQLLKELITADKELQGIRIKYEEELNTVKYKFPEKGEQTKRKYQRLKENHPEQTEKEANQEQIIDKKLENLKKKVDSKLEIPKGQEKYEVRDLDTKKPVKTRQERQETEDEKIILVK